MIEPMTREEGEKYLARGRAALAIQLLTRRFGPLDPTLKTHIQCACIADLESIGDRLLTASTLQEAIGSHQTLLLLFRDRPALAAELLGDVLGVSLPSFHEARVGSADLTDVQGAGHRADMVIELRDDKNAIYGIVVEAQLAESDGKRFAWPAYVANLRWRLECPVSLLVVTLDEAVARWAAQPMELDVLNRFTPYVLGPSRVPEVTSKAEARRNPQLAVLSAIAHGRDADVERVVEIAQAALHVAGSIWTRGR